MAETHAPPHHAAPAASKGPPDHPLAGEARRLAEELTKAGEKHREEVAKFREKVEEFVSKLEGENLSRHQGAMLEALRTEVESAFNRLDPDCLSVS